MSGAVAGLTTVLGVGLALFHMALTQAAFLPSVLVQNVHLGAGLILIALAAASMRRGFSRAWPLAVAAGAAFCMIYIASRYGTLINAAGFLGLAVSSFPPLRQFGLMTSAAFLLALVADFTALPASLWIFSRRANARPPPPG